MTIENPTIDSGNERKRKSLEQVIEAKIRWHIDQAIEENSETSVNSKIFLDGLGRLLGHVTKLIPAKGEELLKIYHSIEEKHIEDGEEFVRVVASGLSKFMLDNFSFDEIENMIRQGKKMLNRLIEYHFNGDEIDIHVPTTFLKNSSELRSLFIDALRKLADKLQNDPEFQNVKKVFAKSWIVFKAHELLEKKFGFTILELDEQNKNGTAEISREKLIEMYGK